MDRCEFCDTPGCHWRNHAEAREDVARLQAGNLPGLLVDHADSAHRPTD